MSFALSLFEGSRSKLSSVLKSDGHSTASCRHTVRERSSGIYLAMQEKSRLLLSPDDSKQCLILHRHKKADGIDDVLEGNKNGADIEGVLDMRQADNDGSKKRNGHIDY